MIQYDAQQIEEYQLMLLKNPRSPVFAALSEAYRKMGLLEEALEATTRGIQHNPEFASGLVAHAKVLYELKDYHEATLTLKKAHALKPENILALRLLGSCYLKLRKPHQALQSLKKLLVLDPNDATATAFIKKWEFLDNKVTPEQLEELELSGLQSWVSKLPSASHALNLVDSFLQADDQRTAQLIIEEAQQKWPNDPQIEQHRSLLNPSDTGNEDAPKSNPNQMALDKLEIKKQFLQRTLQRIEQFKSVDHRQTP